MSNIKVQKYKKLTRHQVPDRLVW